MEAALHFSQVKLLYSRLKPMVQSTLRDGEAKYTKRRLLQVESVISWNIHMLTGCPLLRTYATWACRLRIAKMLMTKHFSALLAGWAETALSGCLCRVQILSFASKSTSDLDHQVQQAQTSELRQRRKVYNDHYTAVSTDSVACLLNTHWCSSFTVI